MARDNAEGKEQFTGTIARVIFHNQENGYSVLAVIPDGDDKGITVTGTYAGAPQEDDQVNITGFWQNNPKYGKQFKATSMAAQTPTSKEGILRYLSSGLIKGLGPALAKRVVAKFGDKTLDVFQNDPERLMEVRGVGKKNFEKIVDSYQQQRGAQDVMMYLQAHNVGAALAFRIYKKYGDSSIETIKENPYRLSQDIHGVGFKTADAIATEVGIEKDSPYRIEAGAFHVMQECATSGHCAVPRTDLFKKTQKLLAVDPDIIAPIVDNMGHVFVAEQGKDEDFICLKYLHKAEKSVAASLKRLMSAQNSPWSGMGMEQALEFAQQRTGLELVQSQRDAVCTALRNKVTVITGGPGVGKTTILNSMLGALDSWDSLDIVLCAPTGRAAKRMSESTGREAATIHRTLEYNPITNSFGFNADNKLDADLVVIDESSMPDVLLTDSLLTAVPDHACVVFLGDIDQLSSVGPGSVLKDMIDSEKIPVVRLTEIFRQAKDSKIIVNAHRINHGQMPVIAKPGEASDFYTFEAKSPEDVLAYTLNHVTKQIPEKLGFDPINDIQVLVPMHKGPLGTENLNEKLQQALNPLEGKKSMRRFNTTYIEGDKVMQTSNDYKKEVFNGDLGRIHKIDTEDGTVIVNFDGRLVEYEATDMDSLILAYATTIHKSQGSEYPCVVMPLVKGHHIMLERNLLYTGVTRGKQMVVVNCEPEALQCAVNTVTSRERQTLLQERIREELHDFELHEKKDDEHEAFCAPGM
jgi:exodeoxyribonuclease V alpha subunit